MSQYCNIFLTCDSFIVNKNVNSEIYKRVKEIEDKINNESDGCEFIPRVFNPLKRDGNNIDNINYFANKVRKSDVVIAFCVDGGYNHEPIMMSSIAYENRIPFILITDSDEWSSYNWVNSPIYSVCSRFYWWDIDKLVDHLKEFYLN